LPDPSWPRADLLLWPICISGGTHRRVRLTLAVHGEHRFSLMAQLFHAGTYGREIVGSARPVHVSSHPLGPVLMALYAPRAGAKRS
jgi:hypothetical protein